MIFGKPINPCGDCLHGFCTMNCSTPMWTQDSSHEEWATCEDCSGDGSIETPMPQPDDPYYARVDTCRECNGVGRILVTATDTVNKTGRDIDAAADRLMRADDGELAMILKHDPDMLRDVAAALIHAKS